MPIDTFSIPSESTQNKQQYVTKITCTEVRGGGGGGGGDYGVWKCVKNVLV